MYLATCCPRVRATRPDTPEPSSMTTDLGDITSVLVNMFSESAIQLANAGVTFQTTAPVVPPARFAVNSPGDCCIDRSWPLTEISISFALESMNPRFDDGIGPVKRRNDSLSN